MISRSFFYTSKSGQSPIFEDHTTQDGPIWVVQLANRSKIVVGQFVEIPLLPEAEHQTWRHRQHYRHFAREAAAAFSGLAIDERGAVSVVIPQTHAQACWALALDLCVFTHRKKVEFLDQPAILTALWKAGCATLTPGGGIGLLCVDCETICGQWTTTPKGHPGFEVAEGIDAATPKFGWSAYTERTTQRRTVVSDAGRPLRVYRGQCEIAPCDIIAAA
jgi:hypothetical protein